MTDLLELRRVGEAEVLKAGRLAARLVRRADGVEFRYLDGYDGPPVATSLPLTDTPVLSPAGAVPPFFAGLLPEGRRLTALRLATKTSADDDLTLLLAVGADTIGDVQVVPTGELPAASPRVEVADFAEVSFRDLLVRDVGDPGAVDRVALPGVQDKVSARMLSVPVKGSSGSAILKFDPPDFPHLVANEVFFLHAAAVSGLPVANATVVHDRDGVAGLLVQRFDRPLAQDGSVAMLAQEDGCQVLGRYPADKYNVTSEEVVAALAATCRAEPVALLDLTRQLAFAYLTGNGDLHAKNVSVVRLGGEWRVAPAYDLPSSYPYGDSTMALPIAGRIREDIARASFAALAVEVGLQERAVTAMLDRLVSRVDRWIDGITDLPFDTRVTWKLRRLVLDRAAKLAG